MKDSLFILICFWLLWWLFSCNNIPIQPVDSYPAKPIPEGARVDSVILVYGEGASGQLLYDTKAVCVSDTTNGEFKILEYRLKNNKVIDTSSFAWIYDFKHIDTSLLVPL